MRGKPWSADDSQFVEWLYPHVSTAQIAKLVGRSCTSVYQLAQRLGLSKTEEYMRSPAACRLRRGEHVGRANWFLKGHVPQNKGVRRPGWAPGRMAETQFKLGQKCRNWLPIGSTRFSKDGYLQRKITDTGFPPRDWRGVHIVMWEEAHGPLPPGHAITFKNGNKADIRLDNLELLSRADLMRRNTIHNLHPELKEVIRLNASIKRTIRRRSGEKQDV